MRWIPRPGWLAALCLVSPITHAETGPAFSGVAASANDASSVFFSPAALTRLDRPEAVLQASFVYQDAKFRVDSSSVEGGNADNDNEILVVPAAFYVHPLGERWRIGLSVNVPTGIGNDYGKKWSGRYLSQESDLAFVAASVPLAYKLTDRWSVAAGPFMIYADQQTKARVNNLLPEYEDGSVRLEEDGVAVGLSLGAMYELSETTRFAATYKTSTDPKLEGTPSFNNLDPLLRETLAAADLLGTEVDVDFKVPAFATAGFYTEFADKWSATGDLTWINMSEFGITSVSVGGDHIVVTDENYRDSWLGSVGLKYRYREDRAVSVGAMYFTSPVSDSDRSIALPFDRIWGVGVGIQRPCWGFGCVINLNYFDKGEGKLSRDGGPLTGSIDGKFTKNWAVMLDFQFRKVF